jgi:hypothetical protein
MSFNGLSNTFIPLSINGLSSINVDSTTSKTITTESEKDIVTPNNN